MVKQPEPGRSKTRLTPHFSADEAAEFSEHLLRDTLAIARSISDATVLLGITPPDAHRWFGELAPDLPRLEQHGDTLGHRLDSVMTAALRQGFDQVMAINSDSPTLPATYLRLAFERLDDADVDVVLGPTVDGGYYAIGWKRRHGSVVTEVTMSTPRVLADTVAIAESLGLGVAQLPEWYDIDEPSDLDRLGECLANDGEIAPHTRRFLGGQAAR